MHALRWLIAPALAVVLACPGVAEPRGSQDATSRRILRLFQWLAAVRTHEPGQADAAIGAASSLPLADLRDILNDVTQLRARLASGRQARLSYLGRTFTRLDLQTVMGLSPDEPVVPGVNRLLRRAAVYHADVAMLAPPGGSQGATEISGGRSAVLVDDGEQTGLVLSSAHWAFGREVLDRLVPSPSDDALARAWYSAAASVLETTLLVSEADDHLSRARQIFPDDARLLFEGGCAIETLTAPTVQGALQTMAAYRRNWVAPTSASRLLHRAEELFRRALEIDPLLSEARVRLARLLSVRNRHDEALEQLRRSLAAPQRAEVRFLATMLIGDEEQALGHREAARASYEDAARQFPTAQAPLLALSHLAREDEDRASAVAALDRLARLPLPTMSRADPWWDYYVMQGRDAKQRMQQLYRMIQKEGR